MASVLEQSRAAAKQDNLAEPTEGGFVREIPAAGAALLRLQSYLEVGTHQPNNKTWKPAIRCIFTFELLHPKHMITPEGKPAFPRTLTFDVWKATSKGSRYIKLFNAMNYDGTHQHFDTMIGDTPFLGGIFHRDNGKTGNDKVTYANLTDKDGNWNIGAPRVVDPLTEEVTEVPIPEMHQEGKLFLWNEPSWSEELIKLAWDTLFIETPEDQDKSRNWIQNSIMEALDYKGSATESAVSGVDIPEEMQLDDKEPPVTDPKPEAAKETVSDADALALLGL